MGVALALSLLGSVSLAGAVEVAKGRVGAGKASVTHAGKTTDVSPTTEFQEGDVLRVPSDGRMTVEFGDGSTVALVGPATFLFGPMNAKGRRMVLVSGAAPEISVGGIAMEIQAPQPYDASLVLQNAKGMARVNPGDAVMFQKLEGDFAKVWRGGSYQDLGANMWNLNVRDGVVTQRSAPGGNEPKKAAGNRSRFTEQPVGDDGMKIVLGGKSIIFHPASSFSRETTANGGLLLTFTGGKDDWGVVEIGLETTLFLSEGQVVEFDANGDVIRMQGIAHMFRSALDPVLKDEPIENAVDASPSLTHSR